MRHLPAVTIASIAAVLLLFVSSGVRAANAGADDEAAIRRIIAAGTIRETANAVYWNRRYKRPTIGNERSELSGGALSYPDRVPGSQKEKVEPIRIVVAESRDMAWEYSRATEEFDLTGGKHIRLTAFLLRVWEKQNGEWRQAAEFLRHLK